MDDLAIGIDLGTTNSCISLFINGRVKILENSDGGRITPSFIFFSTLDETIVGEHAKRMARGKPENGIYDMKRLIGRTFNEECIQNSLRYLPFKIESNSFHEPVVVVEQKDKIVTKTPQELSAIILQKLKKDVEAKLGQAVNKVVITVPAYFNVRQREVTLAAARDAGFSVLKLLNEPTAAALAYYFENNSTGTSFSLVYDLGGGTFDVAVLKKSSNNIKILAVDGDTQLGGHDFDNLIVDYVCDKLIRDYDFNPRIDKDSMRRLHNKCEDAKKALSSVKETVITLIGFCKDYPCIQISLTRKQLETIIDGLLRRSMKIVDSCIRSSRKPKKLLKEVILCGGSTRIPKVQKMLSEYFDGKVLNKFVNPDECVAEGAAIQAAMLSKNTKQVVDIIHLRDVIPLSLGISVLGDEMNVLIKRNSQLPTSASTCKVTVCDHQTKMAFKVYEGERSDARKNRFLGTMIISNLTPAAPGMCRVTFTMNVDENGILTLKANEQLKNNVKELVINYVRGDKSEREVKNAIRDADQNKIEDERFRRFARYKRYLIQYCVAVRYNLDKMNLTEIYKGIYDLSEETEVIGENVSLENEQHLMRLIEEIQLQCEPHVHFYHFTLMPVFKP